MKILILEPFLTGSHQRWAEGYQKHSTHEVEILSLPGRHWKWRMHGGAVALADVFLTGKISADVLLATDMLDLNIFLSLTRRQTAGIPTAIYFHENQLTYPWSPTDQDVKKGRDNHYAFINYTSALTADAVFFNSDYHRNEFVNALSDFLNQFPDFKNVENVEDIRRKSSTLYLGMNLSDFDPYKIERKENTPLLLWNHRWEYDKNPDLFFKTMFRLKEEGVEFQLAVLGESYKKSPPIFQQTKEILKDNLVHFGFAKDFEEYASWLWQADVLPVSSNQDFFGGSVVEAIYCGCFPILPHRLAYPEHIPEAIRHNHFYENKKDSALMEDDLFQKIKNALADHSLIQKVKPLQNFVGRYDWSTLATHYDKVFEKICQR